MEQNPETGWISTWGNDPLWHQETFKKVDAVLRSFNGRWDVRDDVQKAAMIVLKQIGADDLFSQILRADRRRGRPLKTFIHPIERMRQSEFPELQYLAHLLRPMKFPIKTHTDQWLTYRQVQYEIDQGESENYACKLVCAYRKRDGLIEGTKGDFLNIRRQYRRQKAKLAKS